MSTFLLAPPIATTFQGIGGAGGRLHAVQQRLAEGHGSQCGFCTPGIGGLILLRFVYFLFWKLDLSIGNVAVMSMYTLLRNKPIPNMEDIDTYFQVRLHRKLFSFSYIDVTVLGEPLLVNGLWANIDEKVPSVRKC